MVQPLHRIQGPTVRLPEITSVGLNPLNSFENPNTLNLDANPEFWPNLDPDPVQGLCDQF